MNDTDPVWHVDVGYVPYKVTVFEMVTRKRVIYLRWRAQQNWKYESLGFRLYDAAGKRLKGRALKAVTDEATARAKAKHHELIAGVPVAIAEPLTPLRIGEAWAKVSDKDTGLYPIESDHRRCVQRALEAAVIAWGHDTPWSLIGMAEITKLGRHRVAQLRAKAKVGFRGAEETVSRVLTVAQWLRDHELIPRDACLASKRWKEELRAYWMQATNAASEPEPRRPRYTLAEMLAILAAAPDVDPRLDLALALGAELRLGQVVRLWRSGVDLTGSEYGQFRVQTSRKKRSPLVLLTAGQRAALDTALAGYLRLYEARYQASGDDYPLFPAGRLVRHKFDGMPTAVPATASANDRVVCTDTRTLRDWFEAAEDKAEVTHLTGRGWYGMRRRAVDEFKRLGGSKDALKAHGGWTDTTVPDMIYADQEADAPRREAREIRARIRGETSASPAPETTTDDR